jgi:hypothetical protein
MKFNLDTKVNLAVILSAIVFIYTIVKDLYRRYHSRFKMETRIVEWITSTDKKTKNIFTMMRMQLINNSNSPIIVNHIEISDSNGNEMTAADYSHIMFFRKVDEEAYKEPIKTSQFPVTIDPHSGQNICLCLEGKNNGKEVTTIKTGTTNISLETNKGLKKLHPKKVETQLSNIHFFS